MNAQGTSSVVAAEGPARSLTAEQTAAPRSRLAAVRQPRSRVRAACFRTVMAAIDGVSMAVAVGANGGAALQAWTAAATLVCLHAVADGYRPRRVSAPQHDLVPAATRVLLVVLTICALLPSSPPHASADWLAMTITCCVLAGTGRGAAHLALRTYRRRRSSSRTAIVIGCGKRAGPAVQRLLHHRTTGLTLTGQVLPAEQEDDAPPAPLPILGEVEDLARLLDTGDAEVALLVCDGLSAQERETAMRLCMAAHRETILLLAPSDNMLASGVQRLAGMPCRHLVPQLERPSARLAKRTFDVIAAICLLTLALPLIAVCALALRLQDGPGVIFRQARIGQHGRQFTVLKFRTLRPTDDHESDTRWCVEGDVRIAAVGRLLRRTSLDELPQLWNVLRGDMSLVGPRPERPYFVELFSASYPAYAHRHRAPTGMTGWAQVNGLRGNTCIELRAQFDNDYIDTWSFTGDLKIMLLTIRAVLFGDRA
ncbi:sugar transferase [Spirillospora sp. NPDC048911]|uniref:sugar transferase n=1 Tax=Spirillospora sp. NPDC048911 TaxID=3364527 RepID=UPI00371A8CD8